MKRLACAVIVVFVFSVVSVSYAGCVKTVGELLKEAKKVVREVNVETAYRKYYPMVGKKVVFIDVRTMNEVKRDGYIPGAELIPRGFLEFAIGRLLPDGSDTLVIIVYCKTGRRSLLSAKTLRDMGYQNVFSMKGGFMTWKVKGYPVKHLP